MIVNSHLHGTSVQGSIAKQMVSVSGAAIITATLLFIMTQLIKNELPTLEAEKLISIPTFAPVVKDTDPKVITVKPLDLTPPPEIKKAQFDYDQSVDITGVILKIPQTKTPPSDLPDIGGLPPGMALVPLSPRYPDRAAQLGLCGDVVIRYDIGADGVPLNIAIVESSNRLFNKSAISAIERARFKPDSSSGKPIALLNKHEKITYRLDDGC